MFNSYPIFCPLVSFKKNTNAPAAQNVIQRLRRDKNIPLGNSNMYPVIIGLEIPPALDNNTITPDPELLTLVGKDSGPIVNIEA